MAAMNFEPRIFCSRFSEDTGADEERKKVIKKFQRWSDSYERSLRTSNDQQ